MIGRRFEDIDASDILGLVDNQVAESRALDYKQALPGKSLDDMKEFVADVVAFANSGGGDLLYGIIERRDENDNKSGLPERVCGVTTDSLDEEILRLEQVVRSSTDPRLAAIHMKVVTGLEFAPVLLVRVGASWVSPHRSLKDREYHARGNRGKYQMDAGELRQAFGAAAYLPQRLEEIRQSSIRAIENSTTPSITSLADVPVLLVQMVPASALYINPNLDLAGFLSDINNRGLLSALLTNAAERRYNFDGFAAFHGAGYGQLYRSGSIEYGTGYHISGQESGKKYLASDNVVKGVVQAIGEGARILKTLSVALPIQVMVSLLNVGGYQLATRGTDWLEDTRPLSRSHLLFPPIQMDDLDVVVGELTKPVLDNLWQSFGYSRCSYYDRAGNWSP